ncbi:MAG: G1 family glutamic endopeptidase [Thermoleophilaceae bacterium]
MRVRVVAVFACAVLTAVSAADAAAQPAAHGHFVAPFNANQSQNWYGYNQGALEKGKSLFHSVSGDWIVPTASQHSAGKDEYSSTWIGIGGGCVTANCLVTDNTLIQTGTEQDVSASGTPSYSAWWELIPGPGLTISKFRVSPGDHMHALIKEPFAGTELWKITLQNLTKGETFTTTVPYTSTYGTAEWIQETPLVFGTGGAGLAALPNLSTNSFSLARANGKNAGLKTSEEMQLVNSSGSVIGAPSAPNATLDGFNLCTWASTC